MTARLLFVIDNDFGELNMAMLFVHGRALASRTTLMLPPRLFDVNGGGLPLRTLPYSSCGDLIAAIEAEAPDVVFFFSAYLLPSHRLISVAELERLFRLLRNRGCHLVTSDPFWGLLTVPEPLIHAPFKALIRAAAGLRDLVHLYPAPLDVEGVRSMSFFNPSVVDADIAPVSDAFWATAGVSDASARGGFWLFPLTNEDYKTQTSLLGPEGFAARMVELFEDALGAGRCPVLLAPEACIQEVESRFERTGAAALSPYCDYTLFTSLLVHAEHVFCWNAGSTSGHVRVVRGLSLFSFDEGHVARVVDDWLQQTARHYYGGRHPPRLDGNARLRPDVLAALAAEYRPVADGIRRNLARSPAPEAMVAEVLARVEPPHASRPHSHRGGPDDVGL